jgi:hypothetical protein
MNKLDEIIAYKKKEIESLIPLTKKLRASALMRNDFGGIPNCSRSGAGQTRSDSRG